MEFAKTDRHEHAGLARTRRSGERTALLRSFWIAGFDATDHFANSTGIDNGPAGGIRKQLVRAALAGCDAILEVAPCPSDSVYESALREVRGRMDSLNDHSHHRYTS